MSENFITYKLKLQAKEDIPSLKEGREIYKKKEEVWEIEYRISHDETFKELTERIKKESGNKVTVLELISKTW